MEEKIKEYINNKSLSIIVNYKGNIKKIIKEDDVINDKKFSDKITVKEYLENRKIKKYLEAMQMACLNLELIDTPINVLTPLERQKLRLASCLLNNKEQFVFDNFFFNLPLIEQKYFERLLRNLINKQKKKIILFENNMDFISEYYRKFFLCDNKGSEKTNFYEKDIYKFVNKAKTVDLIMYLEACGHKVDHEKTFNETLKAIYRGAK